MGFGSGFGPTQIVRRVSDVWDSQPPPSDPEPSPATAGGQFSGVEAAALVPGFLLGAARLLDRSFARYHRHAPCKGEIYLHSIGRESIQRPVLHPYVPTCAKPERSS